jgi:K+-transporting ATPase ATPase C chain
MNDLRAFLRQLSPALVAVAVLSLLCGLVYPLAVWAVAQVAFPEQADGSLIERDGVVVGSRLVGQAFEAAEYFHPRPSAGGYDGLASGGTNLGPTNPELIDTVAGRIDAYRALNGLPDAVPVPVDAVTSSASGLDPHISVANARLQAPRVARERGLAVDEVLTLVDEHTDRRPLGVLGDEGVNVLELNLALDGR